MTSLPDAVTVHLISLTSHAPGTSLANPSSFSSNTEGEVPRQNLLNGTKPTRVAPRLALLVNCLDIVSRQIDPNSFRVFHTILLFTETSEHHELLSHVHICHAARRSGGAEPKPWRSGDAKKFVRRERIISAPPGY